MEQGELLLSPNALILILNDSAIEGTLTLHIL